MKKPNETTSKRVATKAARVLTQADCNIRSLEAIKRAVCIAIDDCIATMKEASSIAGSALTQAPDKREKPRNGR